MIECHIETSRVLTNLEDLCIFICDVNVGKYIRQKNEKKRIIANDFNFCTTKTMLLRLLTGCFILVRPAMFGATFNLVTSVGLP